VREWLPPVLRRLGNRLLGAEQIYHGPYPDWASARADADGYDRPDILERVRGATEDVLRGEAAYEQDGMTFAEAATPGPALAALLMAAAIDGRLSVLDLGGALASHYLRWRPWLVPLPSLQWQVVEQPHFVEAGRMLFAGSNHPLHFHERVDGGVGANAVLASSVLQYLPDPMAMLASLVETGARVLVVDRTPFSRDDGEHFLVQQVPRRIYPARYPLRSLSRPRVEALLSGRYRKLLDYATSDAAIGTGTGADFRGMVWLRKD
jgi:putative methyltransferase (TIGR04325 family)